MKCAFIIAALSNGGAERVMTTLANELVKMGHIIHIITFDQGDSFYSLDERVNVFGLNIMPQKGILRIFSIPGVEWKRYQKICKHTIREHYDITLSFCLSGNIFNILQSSKNKNVPCIISERNDPNSYKGITKYICDTFYKYADVIVCQNDYSCRYYKGKTLNTKLEVIFNPLNIESLPDSYSLEKNSDIVSVGRLIPQKRFDLLINAFIQAKLPQEYKLKIFGKGPLKEQLLHQIQGANMQDRILLEGVKKDVMKEIFKSRVLVLSSDFEGFPNVLVEAMASGIPVISTDFKTEIAHLLLNDGLGGILVPTNNVLKLSEAIKKVIECEPDKMTIHNFEIRKHFAPQHIAEKWIQVFENAIL